MRETEHDDTLPLAPLDEEEERQRREALRREQEEQRDLLAAMTRRPTVPLEHRENLSTSDLEHFVINYVLDLSAGHRDRACLHVLQLQTFGALGIETVEEFLQGKRDPALRSVPPTTLRRYLRYLRDRIQMMDS